MEGALLLQLGMEETGIKLLDGSDGGGELPPTNEEDADGLVGEATTPVCVHESLSATCRPLNGPWSGLQPAPRGATTCGVRASDNAIAELC